MVLHVMHKHLTLLVYNATHELLVRLQWMPTAPECAHAPGVSMEADDRPAGISPCWQCPAQLQDVSAADVQVGSCGSGSFHGLLKALCKGEADATTAVACTSTHTGANEDPASADCQGESTTADLSAIKKSVAAISGSSTAACEQTLPPLAHGPCGICYPLYYTGLLARPYAWQLAEALSAWHVTGIFPYPAVATQHPPLLHVNEAYHSARERIQALMPQLFTHHSAGKDGDDASTPSCADQRTQQPTDTPSAQASTDTNGDSNAQAEHSNDKADKTQQAAAMYPPEDKGKDIDRAGLGFQPEPDLGTVDLSVLQQLLQDVHAVVVLLGWRITVGSVHTAQALAHAVSAAECLAAFEARHRPQTSSMLTVGARALSKHSQRDTQSSYWPSPHGPEHFKNSTALSALQRLLHAACWINLHQLPPWEDARCVMEVRGVDGYGARWQMIPGSTATSMPTPAPTTTPAASVPRSPALEQTPQASQSLQAIEAPQASRQSQASDHVLPQDMDEVAPVSSRQAEVQGIEPGARDDSCMLQSLAGHGAPAQPQQRQQLGLHDDVGPTGHAAKQQQQQHDKTLEVQNSMAATAHLGQRVSGMAVGCDEVAGGVLVSFRGFLEPQMEGGHEVGWRH